MERINSKSSKRTGYITLKEASELLGVHYSTLDRWLRAGRFEYIRTFGGHRRIRYRDIRQLAETTLVPSGASVAASRMLPDGQGTSEATSRDSASPEPEEEPHCRSCGDWAPVMLDHCAKCLKKRTADTGDGADTVDTVDEDPLGLADL